MVNYASTDAIPTEDQVAKAATVDLDELLDPLKSIINGIKQAHQALFESEMAGMVGRLLNPKDLANTAITYIGKKSLYGGWDTIFFDENQTPGKGSWYFGDLGRAQGNDMNYYPMAMLMKHRGMSHFKLV